MKTLHIAFRIDFGGRSVGPGKIELLEAVRNSRSISQAARDLGMSYRRAWLLLKSLNDSFTEPVTQANTGGANGGGAEVTDFGVSLIQAYRTLETDIGKLARRRMQWMLAEVCEPGPGALTPARRPLHRGSGSK